MRSFNAPARQCRSITEVCTTRTSAFIVESSAGPRLLALHDAVKPQAERYIRMYISMLTGDIRTSVYEHDLIIASIDEGRADDAELAVQVNWRHAADRLSKVIAVAGERGSW